MGEALVSLLDEKGVPAVVQQAGILPPRSSMSAASAEEIKHAITGSPLYQKYAQTEDRRSAYEMLEEVREEQEARAEAEARQAAWEKEQKARERELAARERAYRQSTPKRSTSSTRSRSTSGRSRQTPLEKTINSAANTVGRELGKQIVRGLFGTFRR